MALSTRVGPSVQLTELIRPTKAIKQMRDQPIYIDASKKWACLHQLLTRQITMAMVFTSSLVHRVAFSLVQETTFPAVRIKPTKAVTSLRVNIKPTRPTISFSRANQEVYRVFQDYQEPAAHLTAW